MSKVSAVAVLRLACVCIFAGWGWLHLLGDIPYRAIFWDEGLLKGVVESLTPMTWKEWVSSLRVNSIIQTLIHTTGIVYLCCALATIKLRVNSIWLGRLLVLGGFLLMFLAFLFYKEKFFHLGQFFEYTIQWSAPFFLFLMVRKGWGYSKLLIPVKIAIALTFVCHGLYAVGFYPVPGNFLDMIISILGVSETTAGVILKTVGILDFVLGVLIFLPGKWAYPALIYAICWGMATAFARVTGYFDTDFFFKTMIRWLPETLLRLSHGLIPLLAILLIQKSQEKLTE